MPSPGLCRRLVAAFIGACSVVLTTLAAPFTAVPTGHAGTIGDGIALFVPVGLDPNRLPYSPALVSAPKPVGALPEGWRIAPAFSTDGTVFRASVTIGADDDLYGTGEVLGSLRRNGASIALWNTDNYNYTFDEGRRLYQSHPWVLGVRKDGTSYGVLFNSTWKAELNCDREIIFTSQGPAFPVLVIERASPQEVMRGLAELTGTMPLPPRWALGYQQCRWSYMSAEEVKRIADTFRQRRIPCDVIWMDIDYMEGFRVFTFDKKAFPSPVELSRYLHDRGFKGIWMIDPGVKLDAGYHVYKSGTEQDVWVKTAEGATFVGDVWPGACVFPDFTRPQTRQWWSGLYRDFLAAGVDGVWNDMNEPAVFNTLDKGMPPDNWHRGGDGIPPGPHRRYRNIYGMLMVQATRDGVQAARPEARPFVLTRSNFLGGHRFAATWTGDNMSTEDHLRLSIPMTLTLGLSGQPFAGPDLGGFSLDATPQLWARWVGVGALFPFCRGHAVKDSKPKEPWAFGDATERTARVALERRYRLLPYLYTLFQRASVEGLPVMRPVFFADPSDRSLRTEQQAFMLGDALLVVPRWADNPALPKGDWREVSLIPGDQEDGNQPSLRVRAGAIVPLGRVIQNTTEESLDPLTLLVALDGDGHATGQLYEDAGDGYGYKNGDYLLTTYRAEQRDGSVTVVIDSTEGKRARPKRQVVIQVAGRAGTTVVSGL